MKFAICAVAKEEEDYIDEWIKYHKWLGFDNIFINDDNKNKGLEEYLNKYNYIKVERLFNDVKNNYDFIFSRQYFYYNYFIYTYGQKFDWTAFIDIDEFIVLKKHRNIEDFIKEYNEPSIGGVCLNWITFGTNNLKTKENIPVIKRFTKSDSKIHPFIKTIAKNECLLDAESPHSFLYKDGFDSISPERNILTEDKQYKNLKWMNWEGSDDIACINHYATKSIEELENKIRKGRADVSFYNEMEKYLKEFDTNQIENLYLYNIAIENDFFL